jgi:decaprenylphospho-beta-D-ribofuranose 2-oxidase
VTTPHSERELVPAELPPRGILARGLARSYGDASLNAGGLVVDMTALSGISSFDPQLGRVTAAAGTTLHELVRELVPFGWFLPVVPGTAHVTLGGAIACDVHGKNHHVDGSFCDHVLSLVLHPPEGEPILATRERTPEVFQATAGGMGLTGIISEVSLRLIQVETSRIRVDTERVGDLDSLLSRMQAGDHTYRYSVAWIDLLARGGSMGRAVLTRGDHASVDDLPIRERRNPLKLPPSSSLPIPGAVPGGLLNRSTVRAFNEVWFRKTPQRHSGLRSIHAYFHPLDWLTGWNRLYGRRGFLQYQFVVPFGAEETLRRIVGHLSAARCPSFLAVLKRLGRQDGYLSFPMGGWTLALDIPAGMAGLARFLDHLDHLVLEAGGRVYLAKDGRMKPETFQLMYPRFPAWREVRDKLDPGGVLQSDLARRLELLA